MLLECQHCGAPLDVGKNEPLTRCKYCGTISRSKVLRTIAQETPADFRPPPQWTPPPNMAADSARTLAYHASWAIGRLVKGVITIAVLLTVLPIAAATLIPLVIAAKSTPEISGALQAAQSAMKEAERHMEQARSGAPGQAGADLLTSDGAAGLVEQLTKHLGARRIKALRLVLHPTHAVLDAQDSQKAAHVDRYAFRNGAVQSQEPLNVQSLRGRLERQLFELDDVQLDRMSDMTRKALSTLGYEEAKPTHVIVERGNNGKVVVRVYVSGPRESGRVEFTADGAVQKTYR